MKKKILVCGAYGKMGSEACLAIHADDELELVGAVGNNHQGMPLKNFIDIDTDILIETDIEKAIDLSKPDIVLDLTHAEGLKINATAALNRGIPILSGSTGISEEEKKHLADLALANDTVIYLCSNFAIGAVLMMRFAEQAAAYMPDVEIIELHHDAKRDAPSGTSIKTLERIAKVRKAHKQGRVDEVETISGSRGGTYDGMHVHSVRLSGFNAHQEIIFGGTGQTLTIRHDSLDRTSFMPGIVLALKHIEKLSGLVEELDAIL